MCEWSHLGKKEDSMYLTSKYTQKREKRIGRKVGNGEMEPVDNLLFEFVNKCLLPRFEGRHKTTYLDLAMMQVLDQNRLINLPSLMIKHMYSCDAI